MWYNYIGGSFYLDNYCIKGNKYYIEDKRLYINDVNWEFLFILDTEINENFELLSKRRKRIIDDII